MTQKLQNAVLRRKAGQDGPNAKPGTMSPAKALRLALAGASEAVLKVPLRVGEIAEQRLGPGEVPGLLPPGALILLIEADRGLRGAVALDPEAVAAVIEGMTTGRVTGASAADRRPTATDALLSRRYLGEALRLLAGYLEDRPPPGWGRRWAPGEMIAEARHLPHLLDDTAFRLVAVDVVFSGGAVEGRLWLLLPWESSAAALVSGGAAGSAQSGDPGWHEALGSAVLNVETELEAVLCRFHLPLSQLTRLAPGDLLTFPVAALAEVALQTHDGRTVARARLGRSGHLRALRLGEIDLREAERGAGTGSDCGPAALPAAVARMETSVPAASGASGNGADASAVSTTSSTAPRPLARREPMG